MVTIFTEEEMIDSIEKKKEKLQARIDKLIATTEEKIAPLKEQIVKYDAVIDVMKENGL